MSDSSNPLSIDFFCQDYSQPDLHINKIWQRLCNPNPSSQNLIAFLSNSIEYQRFFSAHSPCLSSYK